MWHCVTPPMDKHLITLFGAAVSLVGCAAILLPWAEITIEFYYDFYAFSYNGIELITSGDFTDPNGIFYGSGVIGVYTPLLVTIAFAAMAVRFISPINRSYFADVILISILIFIGSAYMMLWVNPGPTYYDEGVEYHSFGMGPVASMIVAGIALLCSYYIDHYSSEPATVQPFTYSAPGGQGLSTEETDAPSSAFYCPSCGMRISDGTDIGLRFCKYCGTDLEKYAQDENTR